MNKILAVFFEKMDFSVKETQSNLVLPTLIKFITYK